MDNSEHIEKQGAEDEFEVEITDLDRIGDTGRTQSWVFAESFLNWQRSISRRRWRLVSSVGISLLLVVFLSLSAFSSLLSILHIGLTSNPDTTGTHPFIAYSSKPRPSEQDGLSCLVDAAWSPGSKYIAVVGYRLNCPQSVSMPGLVNLYNVSTGKLLGQLQPDNAILRALNEWLFSFAQTKPPLGWGAVDTSVQQFYYSHLLWSPDGQRLALTFSTATFASPLNGVLLMDVDGKHAQVLLQPRNPSNPLYAEWDVKNGVAVTLALLPPAVAYHWGTGGSLIPIIPLTNNGVPPTSPPGPVGNPNGSATFTVWQSGFANWILLEHESGVYTWSTDFAAWSPDGRYLVDGIGLKGLLSRPGLALPSQQSLVTHHLNQEPRLPAHDTALLRVAALYSAVAWRPDGRVLAAYNSENIVQLYNCVTGRRMGALRPRSNNSFVDGSNVLLRWSPDGSQLLLSSVRWGLVTVWGPLHGLIDAPF